MSDKLNDIIESIAGLTVLELSELVKALEDKFGVTAAAPMAMAMPMMGAAPEAAKDEGPSAYNVVLKEHGSQKINVIKKVKDLAGLGLKEAKDLVDSCPKAVKEGLPEDEAKKIKEELESVGAVVELVGV